MKKFALIQSTRTSHSRNYTPNTNRLSKTLMLGFFTQPEYLDWLEKHGYIYEEDGHYYDENGVEFDSDITSYEDDTIYENTRLLSADWCYSHEIITAFRESVEDYTITIDEVEEWDEPFAYELKKHLS